MSLSRLWQLAAKKLTQDITLEELEEYERLLQRHPQVAARLQLHHEFFSNRQEAAADAQSKAAWQQQLKKLTAEFPEDFRPIDTSFSGQKKMRWRKWLAAAAVATGILLISYFLWNPAEKITTALTNPAPAKVKTGPHDMVLPDGSKVTLNENSNISLSKGFGIDNRDLILEGEAFFDVAHNKQLPFTVQARSVRIKVLGTAFNIRAYADENEVEASLIRGSLEVTDSAQKELRLLLKPNEKITIPVIPQQSRSSGFRDFDAFPYKMETLEAEQTSGIIPETSWMQQKLVFNSESFASLAEKLEKWYKVSITIQDSSLAKEKFTGVFENETIDEALTALQFTFPFRVQKTDKGAYQIKK
ncbi:FecR family protein [Niabella insulamsoli]|uniref:FecR family protein n=1 Tax=Niabella insulamsoli TaxID=3144874 RepID=UPI0031FD4980